MVETSYIGQPQIKHHYSVTESTLTSNGVAYTVQEHNKPITKRTKILGTDDLMIAGHTEGYHTGLPTLTYIIMTRTRLTSYSQHAQNTDTD